MFLYRGYGQQEIPSTRLILQRTQERFIAYDSLKPGTPFSGLTVDFSLDSIVIRRSFYHNGILSRSERYFEDGGSLASVTQFDSTGKETGEYRKFRTDGSIEVIGNYYQGLRHGLWEHFKNDVTIAIGEYRFDKKSGIWKEFDQDGKLVKRSFFRDGVAVNPKTRVSGADADLK